MNTRTEEPPQRGLRLGLIGYGTIAETVLQSLTAAGADVARVVCLAKAGAEDRAKAMLARHRPDVARDRVVGTPEAFLEAGLDLAVECAGQDALRSLAAPLLRAGTGLIPASLGAFSDEAFWAQVRRAARASGAKIHLPAGAIGGLDIIGAAQLAGIKELTYISRKPPAAWRGTPAEGLVELSALTAERTFYEGNARDATRDYPKNANVAAALALAGPGFARTHVRLVADPQARGNIHEIVLRSACADMRLRIEGRPAPDNPRTSLTTGYSVARLVLDQLTEAAF